MKWSLVMLKERYDALQEKMSDKIVLVKEEVTNDDHWFHFEIELKDQFDVLDFFHAGYHAGYNRGVEVFKPLYK